MAISQRSPFSQVLLPLCLSVIDVPLRVQPPAPLSATAASPSQPRQLIVSCSYHVADSFSIHRTWEPSVEGPANYGPTNMNAMLAVLRCNEKGWEGCN